MLSRACIDPFSNQKTQLFTMMIVDQYLMLSYNIISIYGNISLYMFLRSQFGTRMVLNETDQKKQRKRNLVPAYNGIVHVFALIVNYLGLLHMIDQKKEETRKYSKNYINHYIDTFSKSLL